jgi:hypothetical protein
MQDGFKDRFGKPVVEAPPQARQQAMITPHHIRQVFPVQPFHKRPYRLFFLGIAAGRHLFDAGRVPYPAVRKSEQIYNMNGPEETLQQATAQ